MDKDRLFFEAAYACLDGECMVYKKGVDIENCQDDIERTELRLYFATGEIVCLVRMLDEVTGTNQYFIYEYYENE